MSALTMRVACGVVAWLLIGAMAKDLPAAQDEENTVPVAAGACDCSWIWTDTCARQDHCAIACRQANPDGPCHTPGGDEPATCPFSGNFTFKNPNGSTQAGTFAQTGHKKFVANFQGVSVNGSFNLLGNNARLSWRWKGHLLWCSGACPDGPFECQEGSSISRSQEKPQDVQDRDKAKNESEQRVVVANQVERFALRGASKLRASETCTASWSQNCQDTRSCCEDGFTCFEKTPNWAACLQTCTPGIVQPGDDGKQIPWSCQILSDAPQTPLPAPVEPTAAPAPSTTVEEAAAPQVTTTLGAPCEDANEYCASWASSGECESNPGYMEVMCKKSCGTC